MKHLAFQDLQLLLSAIENLNADSDPRTLPQRALSAASKIIAADSVAFTGFGYGGEYAGIAWENAGNISPTDIEVFARHMHENPLLKSYTVERRTETLKITDLISPKEFKRTNLYNEFYRRVGVSNQLVAPLLISNDFFMSCSINTSCEDFSERDKLILTLMAPHLANAVRGAFAYERLISALETENCGIVTLDANGKPLFISDFARRLFDCYFTGETLDTNFFPQSLCDWLKQINNAVRITDFRLPPKPLKIENQHGALTVRFVRNAMIGENMLLFEEKKFFAPETFEKLELTKREAEVLFWITQGKTDEEIAALCNVSVRTIHKHVEHIYIKLGVETRTGAMLKAIENT